MTNKLGMNFPDDTAVDFGSIVFDRHNEHLHLLAVDIDKLNSTLTSGGQKVKTAQGLCDSINVTAKTRFNLDGEAFFALNGNIVIKL